MDNADNFDVITRNKHLQAENESLKEQLQEYRQTTARKNFEQRELEEKVSTGAAVKSSFDHQTDELKLVRNYIFELMQKAEAAAQREAALEKEITLSVNTGYQLEEIKSKYNYLVVQLNDLSERLQQLNNQHFLQMQYAGRVAELESLLAIAEEEIELLKGRSEK